MRARQPHPPFVLGAVVIIAAGSLVLPGCGGSASKAEAPPPADAPQDNGEAAQADLDKAEWSITELFGPPGGTGPVTPPPAASAAPTVTAGVPATVPNQTADRPTAQPSGMSGGDSGGAKGADACTVACSALASMERASRHLCELAGPDDALCTSSRERVRNANDRVAAHCTCGL